ncbi:hypothetical protein ANN_09615 [Periplaneta americana]|uniref:Uncharacterized protein n=1 Tax=Periplaneta americana TaxID=6978 RepID=A0ABQ8TMU3_PERAM|nr:hypothetical protein ANN_09615 [Periplaneta americana]
MSVIRKEFAYLLSGLSANDDSGYNCSANDRSPFYRYKTASIDYSRICNRKRISENHGGWKSNTVAEANHILYHLRVNSWISTKKGLSSSQWTQAIEMNCNTIPVCTLPGRTLDSTRCRRCDEQETLPHVLGFCHHGELLRINRHNTVRSLIAASIRQNASYEVYEEVGCVSSDGSTRRADIIIDRQKEKGIILDPSVRFEMHEQQPQEVENKSYMSLVVSILEHNTTSHIGQFVDSCSVPVARSHEKL